jgi:acyl carrier protein
MTDDTIIAAERPAPPTEWPEMSEPDMLERILKIVVEEGKIDADLVAPAATLESLGLMSIDVVSILMGLEEEFDAYIPMTEDLSSARNLSELITVVLEQMRPDELQALTPHS